MVIHWYIKWEFITRLTLFSVYLMFSTAPTNIQKMLGDRHNLAKNDHNNQRMVAPSLEDENNYYICECHSCNIGTKYRGWIPRGFFAGFFIPLLWFCNLVIYLYTQWHLNHEPTHAQIALEELPSNHEFQSRINASNITLDKSTIEEIDRVNEKTTVLDDPKDHKDCPKYNLQDYRNQFLRQVASDIIESHGVKRDHYKKWTQWSLLGIVTYSVTTVLAVIAYKPR